MSAPTPPAGLSITVYGGPAPQGSKRYLGAPGGKGRMVEMSKRVAPWRSAVVDAARTVIDSTAAAPLDGPLAVRMIFTLRKPASAPKRRRTWPDRTPDLSKLARSTEDALTDAGAIADDARIVEYLRLAKVYPGEDVDALDVPGARIWIGPVTTAATVPAYPVCPACDAANYGAFECPTCRAHWPVGDPLAARLAANHTTVLNQLGYPDGELPEEADHFEVRTKQGTAWVSHDGHGWQWQCQASADCDRKGAAFGYEIPQDAEKAARRHLAISHLDQAQQEVRADG